MDLYNKIKIFLDFNNFYSIKKFIQICEHEFDISCKSKHNNNVEYLIKMSEDVLAKLEDFCESDPTPRMYVKHMKRLIEYMKKNEE